MLTPSGRCLRVGMVQYPIMTEVTGSAPHVQYSGPTVTLVHLLAQHLGYCLEFIDSRLENYGQLLDNNSWTGLMGMLQRGEVDMGGTLFSVTWRRWQAVDFTHSLYVDHSNVMYARPEVSSDMTGFTKPYTLLVWVAVLLASLVFFVTLIFLTGDVGLHTLTSHKMEPSTSGWVAAAEKSSAYTWMTLVAQSVPRMPESGPARFAGGLWLLSCLIIGTVYRSNLKAMLIIPKLALPFDSLEELVESGLSVAVIEGTTMHIDVVRAEKGTKIEQLKERLLPYPVEQQLVALANTLSGQHASFGAGLALLGVLHLDFSMNGKCRIYLMSQGVQGPRSLSFALPKASPLTDKINHILMRLLDAGIVRKILMDAIYNSTECLKPLSSVAGQDRRPLELMDFYGVFSLYAAGMAVALVSFGVEVNRLVT